MTSRYATRPRQRSSSSAKAGLITTLMTFANITIGFFFQAQIASSLGVGAKSDAFQLSWTIVTFGAVTIFSIVLTFLVPKMQLLKPNEVAISNAVFPIVIGLLLSISQIILGFALEPSEVATILFWSAPSIFLAGLCAAPQAIAYIQKRFALAALGPVANGLALLGFVCFYSGALSPEKLGLALAVGYLAQFLVSAIPLLWERPTFIWQRTISVWAITGVTLFTLLAKFQPVSERILSSLVGEGATSALGYGQKVAQGLVTVAAFGLALTAMASLSRHINSNRLDEAARVLSRTLTGTVAVAAVVVSFALPLAWLATVILFLRGNFQTSDAQYVANIIVIQLPWVFSGAVTGVLTGYLYAQNNYLRVVGVSLVGIAGTLVTTVILARFAPLYSVAIASTVGAALSLLWAFRLVARSPIWNALRDEIKPFRPIFSLSITLMVVSCVGYSTSLLLHLEYSNFAPAITLTPLLIVIALRLLSSNFRDVLVDLFRSKV